MAGPAVAAVFVAGTLALTLLEHRFLAGSSWDPVARSAVEWPSILALGPYGWAACVLFGLCGGLGVVFATAFLGSAEPLAQRLIGACVLGVSAGLFGVTFPTAFPRSDGSLAWHATVHNTAYLLVPVFGLLGMAVGAFGRGPGSGRTAMRFLLLVAVACAGAMTIDHVAQLVRYAFFGTILVWITLLGAERVRAAEAPTGTGSG